VKSHVVSTRLTPQNRRLLELIQQRQPQHTPRRLLNRSIQLLAEAMGVEIPFEEQMDQLVKDLEKSK
jgi:hypothetical protein